MSTSYVEQSIALMGRVEGQELLPHAIRLLADGEPVPPERLAAAAGWSVPGRGSVQAGPAGHRAARLGGPVMRAAATSLPAVGNRRSRRRAVGRWGTVARVLCGSALIVLAIGYWRADWLDLLIGLVALPTVATLAMFLRARSAPPLRLGAAGHLVTVTHVAITASLVGEAAALFYGSMALVAALHGNGGCEITVLANWLRGRDDRVGCPLFAPFDALDGERACATADRSA